MRAAPSLWASLLLFQNVKGLGTLFTMLAVSSLLLLGEDLLLVNLLSVLHVCLRVGLSSFDFGCFISIMCEKGRKILGSLFTWSGFLRDSWQIHQLVEISSHNSGMISTFQLVHAITNRITFVKSFDQTAVVVSRSIVSIVSRQVVIYASSTMEDR